MVDGLPPLEAEIRRRIALAGPMPVAQYMALCLSHPVHGYYVTRDPLGTAGDFTTAPEISQMFGELVGLWVASVWRMMGVPDRVNLVELGPGRGTLMLDAMRAARVVPGFREAVTVHLVEISPALRRRQRQTLGGSDLAVVWHESLGQVPEGPLIVLANEFFDALPVNQAVKRESGWHERVVEIDAVGNLRFGVSPTPLARFERILPPHVRHAPAGALFEWRADHVALELARRVVHGHGAALVIDYGHARSETGDTLQAVGDHAFADPLQAAGMVDLTAHVDFQALGEAAESMGARAQGPIEQGEFLRRLGIEVRAAALKANARPEQAADIDSAFERLTGHGKGGMGRLFKVMALADPELGLLPAFEE